MLAWSSAPAAIGPSAPPSRAQVGNAPIINEDQVVDPSVAAPGAAPPCRIGRQVSPVAGNARDVATVVAVFGGLVGLVVQFVPGVGVQQHPPRSATMTVRDVVARITRGDYATKSGAHVRLDGQDRNEVGNVIRLEVRLEGYRGERPELQYASYDPGSGGALLPGTAKQVTVIAHDDDVQTLFVPIWVGYPRSRRCEVQFRLLDGQRVQQLAGTGKMMASTYRCACSART